MPPKGCTLKRLSHQAPPVLLAPKVSGKSSTGRAWTDAPWRRRARAWLEWRDEWRYAIRRTRTRPAVGRWRTAAQARPAVGGARHRCAAGHGADAQRPAPSETARASSVAPRAPSLLQHAARSDVQRSVAQQSTKTPKKQTTSSHIR